MLREALEQYDFAYDFQEDLMTQLREWETTLRLQYDRICGLSAYLSFFDSIWVKRSLDNLWYKIAKWSIGLISCLRQ